VRLNPETGEIAQTVGGIYARSPNAFSEYGLAAGEGGVWVGYVSVVQHVDPLTGTVRSTIRVPQLTSIVVPVVGFRTVWVTTGTVLYRINPATDQLLRQTRMAPRPAGLAEFAVRIAVGEAAVWLSSSTTVFEVDPIDGKVVRELDIGTVDGLAAGEGAVWVTDELSAELLRLDPATGEVAGSVSLAGGLDAVAVGGGRAWVLDRGAGTVTAVDVGSLAVLDTVRVGSDVTAMVFGGGSIWLADGSDGSVTRLDPETLVTAVFPVEGHVANVAVDPESGDVWALVVPEG
jgi:streptogramin lyase